MNTDLFKKMSFSHVEGTLAEEDGDLQFVQISLQKNKGRREANISNIINEYNNLSCSEPIKPISIPGMPRLITCFKISQPDTSNPILACIHMKSPHYWKWDAKATDGGDKDHLSDGVQTQAKPSKAMMSGLENIIRELNLDPTKLCMDSAYEFVSNRYLAVMGVNLNNSGMFPVQYREFFLSELSHYFQKELFYVVSPPKPQMDANALALMGDADRMMGDLEFQTTPSTTGLNETVKNTFSRLIDGQWRTKKRVSMTTSDLLDAFNHESMGIYRKSCIAPFMEPLTATGAVQANDKGFDIDVPALRRVLRKK